MDLEKENMRIVEENLALRRENDYLKMIIDRLIPIPISNKVQVLENRFSNIENRLEKIEDGKCNRKD